VLPIYRSGVREIGSFSGDFQHGSRKSKGAPMCFRTAGGLFRQRGQIGFVSKAFDIVSNPLGDGQEPNASIGFRWISETHSQAEDLGRPAVLLRGLCNRFWSVGIGLRTHAAGCSRIPFIRHAFERALRPVLHLLTLNNHSMPQLPPLAWEVTGAWDITESESHRFYRYEEALEHCAVLLFGVSDLGVSFIRLRLITAECPDNLGSEYSLDGSSFTGEGIDRPNWILKSLRQDGLCSCRLIGWAHELLAMIIAEVRLGAVLVEATHRSEAKLTSQREASGER
jgi:hypothetical protein